MAIDFSRHPIGFVQELSRQFEGELIFEFGRYLYRPRSTLDEREVFTISSAELTTSWLQRELDRLDADYELAFHSLVRHNGSTKHIPLIDFHGMSDQHLHLVKNVIPAHLAETPAHVFASGRSFHAYFETLIQEDQWVRFMGSLLLSNYPSRPMVVDQRWVGHRLIAGYGALRWSQNTKTYRQIPEIIDPRILRGNKRRLKKNLARQ